MITKTIFRKIFLAASTDNEQNIIATIQRNGKSGNWLDLGCDDGSWTERLSQQLVRKRISWYGVEVVKERARLAESKGIKVSTSSLTRKLPFKDNFFSLVHSNQVIEHLVDLDLFLSEVYRVLKPNGIFVVSTENPASWHNIAALILGWQMFSQTNISVKKRSIGNPMAIFSNDEFAFDSSSTNYAWLHQKLLTPRALSELLAVHDYSVVDRIGAGYHPLPSKFARADINHSHFYVIAARKNK